MATFFSNANIAYGWSCIVDGDWAFARLRILLAVIPGLWDMVGKTVS